MFHFKNGLCFERLPQGSVRLASSGGTALFECTANEWASVVAAMCADGETAHTYNEALDRQLNKSA